MNKVQIASYKQVNIDQLLNFDDEKLIVDNLANLLLKGVAKIHIEYEMLLTIQSVKDMTILDYEAAVGLIKLGNDNDAFNSINLSCAVIDEVFQVVEERINNIGE